MPCRSALAMRTPAAKTAAAKTFLRKRSAATIRPTVIPSCLPL
jgi:hypothetical protein